ncbi:unnamed protein product [Closterium sp. NIES-64]|nr:unnamed protein product [Closterium sp. NIES-64]
MDSNNGTPAPFPTAGMGEMKRGKPPVNNGRVSPRTPGQAPPQKKPIGAPRKKVVKKALPKAPAGDPMEEFFAIMEQFVDEPEEMECVRLAEVSRANRPGRMQKPQMGGSSSDGFPADLGWSKMEKQIHSGPMSLAPASPKVVQKTQLPRAASRDSEKSRVHPAHARTHSVGGVGGLKDLNSLWNPAASPAVKVQPIQRASSVKEGHEMQSLVDALKAEIKAKDKLLEASEKEQQMLQEELKHAWNSTDELQRQLNDSEALVLKLQHENEVLRSAKRVLTTSPTDLSRRLAATESRNVELAEKMAACEKELEMTKIALQQAAQERDSLAEEMEAALASWAVDSPATPASGISSGTFSHSTSTSSNSSSQDEVQQLAMALDGVQRKLRVARGERDALMAAVRPSGRVNVNSPAGRSLRKSSSALSVPSSQQQQQAAQFNYKAIRQTVDSNPRGITWAGGIAWAGESTWLTSASLTSASLILRLSHPPPLSPSASLTLRLSHPPPLSSSASLTLHLSHPPPLSPSASLTLRLSHPPPLSPSASLILRLSHPPPLSPSASLTLRLSHPPPLSPSASLTLRLSHPPPLSPSTSLTLRLSHLPPLSPSASLTLRLSHPPPLSSSASLTLRLSHTPPLSPSASLTLRLSHPPPLSSSASLTSASLILRLSHPPPLSPSASLTLRLSHPPPLLWLSAFPRSLPRYNHSSSSPPFRPSSVSPLLILSFRAFLVPYRRCPSIVIVLYPSPPLQL